MAATDQQMVDALRDTYLRVAGYDAATQSDQLHNMGFKSLKEMGAEIERLEARISRAGNRRIFFPVNPVNV